MMLNRLEEIKEKYRKDGGPGSGNWGHSGVEGQHGGSAPGGGTVNRYVAINGGGYTSFAKMRNEFAKPHVPSASELKTVPKGTKLIAPNGESYIKQAGTKWMAEKDAFGHKTDNGTIIGGYSLNKAMWNKEVKLAVPKSAEEEFMKDKAVKSFEIEEEANVKPEWKQTLPNKDVFPDDGFSQERVDAAKKWPPDDTVGVYAEQTENAWAQLDQQAKNDLYSYTTGSSFVNEPLHEVQYKGYKNDDSVRAINNITEAIDKCSIPQDTIMYHGLDKAGFQALMGMDGNLTKTNMNKLSNKVGIDEGFVSCGAGDGTGFQHKDVVMEIFVPQGAKGMYVEPFSHYGAGDKSPDWDGKVTQSYASGECEVILQRGGAYKVTGAYKDGTQWRVQCQLVNQDTTNMKEETFSKYAKNLTGNY